jgi:hypothetical protein
MVPHTPATLQNVLIRTASHERQLKGEVLSHGIVV